MNFIFSNQKYISGITWTADAVESPPDTLIRWEGTETLEHLNLLSKDVGGGTDVVFFFNTYSALFRLNTF